MTKYSFFFKCIEEIFTPMVASNFSIENYNSSFRVFYEDLFFVYKTLSKYYDECMNAYKLSPEEKEAKLIFFINIISVRNLNNYFLSLDKVIKTKGLDYNIVSRYETLSSQSSSNKTHDVYNQILKEIRQKEEESYNN